MKLHFDDLTQITCPFGMLDDDTQTRLKKLDYVQHYGLLGWQYISSPRFVACSTYRAKPAPKRRVEWSNVYPDAGIDTPYSSRTDANFNADAGRVCVFRIEYDADTGLNPTITREEV